MHVVVHRCSDQAYKMIWKKGILSSHRLKKRKAIFYYVAKFRIELKTYSKIY